MKHLSIILVTDSIPSPNGGGISQTLYNLLDNCPSPIFIVAAENERIPDERIAATILRHPYHRYKNWANRLGKYINPIIEKANYNFQERHPLTIDGLPSVDESFVLVSTTSPIKLQVAWLLHQKKGYAIVPYFMDDWMKGMQLQWKGNTIQKIVAAVLAAAPAWLMISQQLQHTLTEPYKLAQKPCMVVHNPVQPKKVEGDCKPDEGLIIYAGSIWPMHLDAIVLVSQAVQKLQAAGHKKYRLLIYTGETVWQHNRPLLDGPGVSWGGLIPYQQLHKKLAKGWLLLCASSFKTEYGGFTKSSVQTKLTDYMNAERPVLYAGPADGASGWFVNHWKCGFTANENNVEKIAAMLEHITEDECEKAAAYGKQAVLQHFSKEKIQQQLYQFLQRHAEHIGLAAMVPIGTVKTKVQNL